MAEPVGSNAAMAATNSSLVSMTGGSMPNGDMASSSVIVTKVLSEPSRRCVLYCR